MAGPNFYVTARVESENRFHAYGQAVSASLNRAAAEAAAIVLKEVRAAETRVGQPRADGRLPGVHVPDGVHLRDSFRAGFLKDPYYGFLGAVRSLVVIVESGNPNAIWQEYGTRGRRKKSLKPGSSSRDRKSMGNRGVKPLHFMRKGLARAFPQVQVLIEDAVAGAGDVLGGSQIVDTTSPISPAKGAGVTPRFRF